MKKFPLNVTPVKNGQDLHRSYYSISFHRLGKKQKPAIFAAAPIDLRLKQELIKLRINNARS